MSSISSTAVPSSTSPSPSASSSVTPPPAGGDSPTSRPLLFFVALGFGVVFTNLWIIVGVKYCFRYNRRRPHDENGDPIDMGNMPRPRRKREKKLMTMDEVNERFPLTKYKIWRATRELDGLPAAGGITAPPSRAQSIRQSVDAKRVSTEPASPTTTEHAKRQPEDPRRDSGLDGAHEDRSPTDAPRPSLEKLPHTRPSLDKPHIRIATPTPDSTALHPTTTTSTADDDPPDDPIQAAGIPSSCAQTPGDTCAICIDTLEDSDDVRGLSCGHAFHAGCLDPWLTSRRACCPLCKADYYVPKPKPEADGGEGSGDVQRPAPVYRGGARYAVSFRYRYGFPTVVREEEGRVRGGRRGAQRTTAERTEGSAERPAGRFRRLRSHLAIPRLPFRWARTEEVSANAGAGDATTPRQLEAGTSR